MKAIGITCEYNPFHKGHQHQLHTLAETAPDALRIAVMSGSFVQRGEPAFFSKFDRARWAVWGGADVVIELPAVYALGSAEIFATGAVRLMKALNIDALSFGTEYDNLNDLQTLAAHMTKSDVQDLIRELIGQGLSYGTALRQAMSKDHPFAQSVINSPNTILGLEYLKAARLFHKEADILPILRTSRHHSESLPVQNTIPSPDSLPSGSALRKALIHKEDITAHIPQCIAADLKRCLRTGAYVDYSRYHDMIQTVNRLQTPDTLKETADFTEGIEHRWYKGALRASWPEALESIKTKRYTYARLNRMAAYMVLGIRKDLMHKAHAEGPQYARLLAFNRRGREWLRQSFAVPVIQKWAGAHTKVSPLGLALLNTDTTATDIQHLAFTGNEFRRGHQDFTVSPQYIED